MTQARPISLESSMLHFLHVNYCFWLEEKRWIAITGSPLHSVTCHFLLLSRWQCFMIVKRLSWINSLTFHYLLWNYQYQSRRQRSNVLRRVILQKENTFSHSNHQFWAIGCFWIQQSLIIFHHHFHILLLYMQLN